MGGLTVLKLASNVIRATRRNCISADHKPEAKFYSRSSKTDSFYVNDHKKMLHQLPIYASGEIVRGFGRGSKELGIPTANLALDVVKSLPESLHTGVYYGWSNVNNGEVYKMVLSVGWNPFYNNKEKSVETHMLHKFDCDLYGQTLKICIVGYLRPEKNFDSLDDLIKVIKSDIEEAKTLLDKPENRKLQENPFFSDKISKC
ncbi:putative riboflavin kinase [Drosophila montana]|uniref:putative riboflavin kinase n=1 Tax=Drosophila montana TaxID=40370 RepID=UPI00313F1B36